MEQQDPNRIVDDVDDDSINIDSLLVVSLSVISILLQIQAPSSTDCC